MNWSDQAWQASLPIYEGIIKHPFLMELMDGTLAIDKFRHYIQQDVLYLRKYEKALSILSEKLQRPEDRELFKRYADDSVKCEEGLHETFIRQFEIPKQEIMSTACKKYTSFLLDSVENKPLETGLAAVLPCFRVYNEVGMYLVKHQSKGNNPYDSWINAYSGDEFTKDVILYNEVCNPMAEKLPEKNIDDMTRAYIMATELEYEFWDTAYKLKM